MDKKELLFLYAGLFEEVFEKNEGLMHEDNYNDYRRVCRELRDITGMRYGLGYLERLDSIENELPFS